MSDPKVTRLHISELHTDTDNPMVHGEENIAMIAGSIEAAGFSRSIVIDENDAIVLGNGATEAAGIVGLENVIVVEADGNEIVAVRRRGLSEEQKQRLKLDDNVSSRLADYNAPVIAAMAEEGHIDLSRYFSPEEIEGFYGGEEIILPPQETEAHYVENPYETHQWAVDKNTGEFLNPDEDGSRTARLASLGVAGTTAASSQVIEGDTENSGHVKPTIDTGVRMLQLFLTVTQHAETLAKVKQLAQAYDTTNITDTIVRAIDNAHVVHFGSNDTETQGVTSDAETEATPDG